MPLSKAKIEKKRKQNMKRNQCGTTIEKTVIAKKKRNKTH